MSIFAEYEDLVTDAVDEFLGDEITVIPLKVGEVVDTADNDRPLFTVTGVIDFIPETIKAKGKEGNDGFQPNLTTSVCHISISEAELTSKGRPQKGDLLTAQLKSGPIKVKVSTDHPDKLGRVIFVCKKV